MTSKDPPKRDKMGLEVAGPKTKTEAQARAFYYKMLGTLLFVIAPVITLVLLWLLKTIFPRAIGDVHSERIALLHQYDLGWLYAAWYVLYLTRTYLAVNSNGARAAARVGRPDQHVYKLYNSSSDTTTTTTTPYVLMETAGPVGKFNRAQRAAFHMDESVAFVLTSILLTGIVLPRVVLVLVMLYGVGRMAFANGYTASLEGRMTAMIYWVIPEQIIVAMVGIFAVQSIVFSSE